MTVRAQNSLSTIQQAVEVAQSCPVYWYRGQPAPYGNLTPKVFRDTLAPAFQESHYVALFQTEARSVELNCPERSDHLAWLFLMQHHGCPTRLLDWSESILVALYFAVTSDAREDGELWCLHPGELNNLSVNVYGIVTDVERVRKLARDAALGVNEQGEREVDVGELPKSPVAIAPSLWFRRGVNQLSRFTIHPRPGEGAPIEDTLQHPNLVRYLIPSGAKQGLEDALYAFGIRANTMFPDLDGISRGICDFVQRLRRGSVPCTPRPPSWEHD